MLGMELGIEPLHALSCLAQQTLVPGSPERDTQALPKRQGAFVVLYRLDWIPLESVELLG